MKKTTWLLGTSFLGGTLLATMLAAPVVADTNAGPGTANANLSGNTDTIVSAGQPVFTASATQNASAKSTAQFTVDPGQLTLVAVPDLNFGAVPPATIVNGGQKLLENKNVDNGSSKGKSAFDGNKAGKLIVSDMRGTGGGWKLSASMDSQFTSGDSTLKDLSINLAATGSSSSFFGSDKPLNLKETDISDTATYVVETTDANNGVGDTTFNLNAASLKFPDKTNGTFKENAAYQSDVTWTLVAAQ